MIDRLRRLLAAAIIPELADYERRLALAETDLDCDVDGSLAGELAETHAQLHELRARVDDWIPTAAERVAGKDDLR